ncbi:MAG: 3-phosphoshikimate 1-carboxyvinyltransferase [Phycisphaerales bacterium]|nr:MAG: 3-phosphoshikimate 1-carboxyvinyltransferase [Phycisphaerales bacterium]
MSTDANCYACPVAAGPLDADVVLPGSKSLTIRALMAAALADGDSVLAGASTSDDARAMLDVLERLGIATTVDEEAAAIEVTGCRGHVPGQHAVLYCGAAGAVMRFATALCAAGFGDFRLDGTARLRQRPMEPLVDALRGLGALVEFHGVEGYPPLTVHARHLAGGPVGISAVDSSQFASALLMASVCAVRDVMLEVPPPIASRPYLDVTLAVMDRFGVATVADDDGQGGMRIIVPAPQVYRAAHVSIEPDASAATVFLSAAALRGGRVSITGLAPDSLQGDARFADVLERMGCAVDRAAQWLTVVGPQPSPLTARGGGSPPLSARGAGPSPRLRAVDVDLSAMPDTVPTLAALALFADGPTRIRNVAHLRLKESDRLEALRCELTRIGARVDLHADGLTIHPAARYRAATIETYDDHRMVMAFCLAGLGIDGLSVRDPDCASKSFPGFTRRWEAMLGGGLRSTG